MIGVMYGEPWNCPEEPEGPKVTFRVDMRPPVDLRHLLAAQGPFITVVEAPPKEGWRDRLRGFMLALAEGTDP